jgi:hypothetical protein
MSVFDDMLANVVVDKDCPPNTVFLLSPRYKKVQDGTGEPPRFKEVLDLEATAKASAVIYNIGGGDAQG